WKYKKLVAIGLFCILVVDLLDLIPPLLLQSTIDHLTQTGFNENSQLVLLEFAIAYFSISILQAIGRYGWRIFLIRTSMMSGRDLRERFAKHLFSLSTSFFQRHRSGDLMALATNDTEAVRMALGAGMITFADAAFYLLTIPIAMFWLSPELTL